MPIASAILGIANPAWPTIAGLGLVGPWPKFPSVSQAEPQSSMDHAQVIALAWHGNSTS